MNKKVQYLMQLYAHVVGNWQLNTKNKKKKKRVWETCFFLLVTQNVEGKKICACVCLHMG